MATNIFIVHRGSLDGDEELTGRLGLAEGQSLFVVSSNDQEIILRRGGVSDPRISSSVQDWKAAWASLKQSAPPPWTPEWQAKAEERRRLATENLNRVYADESSGTTEMRAAERELEFANDELMGGPYPER